MSAPEINLASGANVTIGFCYNPPRLIQQGQGETTGSIACRFPPDINRYVLA